MRPCVAGLAAVCVFGFAAGAAAQSPTDRALDAQIAKCKAVEQRKVAEGNAELKAGTPEPEKMFPLMAEGRACWADYDRLQAAADRAASRRNSFVREERSDPPQYARQSGGYQPPPQAPARLPQTSFDPGYASKPPPTVVCAGRIMVLGPPDNPSACAGQ